MKHSIQLIWLALMSVYCTDAKPKYQSPIDLHTAVADGDLEMVKRLVTAGHDVNMERSGFGWITTPLMLAINRERDDVAAFLITQPRIKLRLGDDHSPTPFHAAVCNDRMKIAKLLLAKGGRPRKADLASESPMNCPARKGNLEMVDFLIQSGFSVNSQKSDLPSPLHESTNARISALLLDNGAEVDQKNWFEHTPLMDVLARGGDYDTVKVLLDAGADPNTSDAVGNTAYAEAKHRGAPKKTLELLIEYGAKKSTRKYVFQNE